MTVTGVGETVGRAAGDGDRFTAWRTRRTVVDVGGVVGVDRRARGLAAASFSSHAEGSAPAASEKVDRTWPEDLNPALAVLHTAREPDTQMATAGDAEIWKRMVEIAIEEAEATAA